MNVTMLRGLNNTTGTDGSLWKAPKYFQHENIYKLPNDEREGERKQAPYCNLQIGS